ncbi:MAG: SURF1 family protein [Candidatus Porifericomitaceae bacterium WSBS_2022_MAG_OTU9]
MRICISRGTGRNIIALVLSVAVSGVCATLGNWQLVRADWKSRQLQQAHVSRQLPPVELASPSMLDGLAPWRPVAFMAAELDLPLIYLDNQIRSGKAGYEIYRAIQLQGTGHAALQNISWLPVGHDRAILPKIEQVVPLPTEAVLLPPPTAGLDLGGATVEYLSEAMRVQAIDFTALGELLGVNLIPYALANGSAAALPRYRIGPERHMAYAVQWFALAALLPVLVIGYNLSAYLKRREATGNAK